MAHLAVGFLTLGLLAVVLTNPAWFAPLFIIPILLSAAIVRFRTVADSDQVTARTLLDSETCRWEDIDGLRFGGGAWAGSWALAQRKDGTELRLPAVTFATLPLLADVSGGRVPNPYA